MTTAPATRRPCHRLPLHHGTHRPQRRRGGKRRRHRAAALRRAGTFPTATPSLSLLFIFPPFHSLVTWGGQDCEQHCVTAGHGGRVGCLACRCHTRLLFALVRVPLHWHFTQLVPQLPQVRVQCRGVQPRQRSQGSRQPLRMHTHVTAPAGGGMQLLVRQRRDLCEIVSCV